MTETFRAWLVSKDDSGQTAEVTSMSTDDLMKGDVSLRVLASTVNYKDGLALTGKGPVIRHFPLIPGIDLTGEVTASDNPEFSTGDLVVLTGYGIGETHHGGLAERARVRGDWLVPLPPSMTPARAMAIGTAGFTAMLCVMTLEDAGVSPERGEVLVTGAAGGVGGIAVAVLSGLGYTVVASTGRAGEADYLSDLGASEVIGREPLSGDLRPLARPRWAGAVDVVGSVTLAHVLSQMNSGGAVAACGLAQGMDLPTSVAPFILRGVSLRGVDSVMCPMPRRREAWRRLESDLDMSKLDAMTSHVGLADALAVGERILQGQVRGRVVVDVDK